MLLTMAILPPLAGLAHRIGVLAYPDARRHHEGAVPQIGGIAIATSALVAMSLLVAPQSGFFAYLGGAVIVCLLGLLDDYRELDYRFKFAVHFVAVIIAIVGAGLMVVPLNPPLPDLPIWLALPLATLLLVGTTNAVNLVDGLDGLAGGLTLLSCLALAICGYQAENALVFVITLTIAGSVVGFLRFNTHPARIFMGDSGALFLGFSLGFVVLELCRARPETTSLTALMMMLGVPVLDAMRVALRRLLRGRNPFMADRSHLHHQLLDAGFKHGSVVALIYALHTALIVAGYTLRHQNELLLLAMYAGIAVGIDAAPTLLAPVSRWVRRRRIRLQLASWFDRALDASAWVALLTFVVAAVIAAPISGDFLGGAIVALVALLAWWIYAPHAAVGLPERAALYVLGAYTVYLGTLGAGGSAPGSIVELVAFGVIGIWLVFRLVGSGNHEFTLTPLDLLVAVTTLGAALLSDRAFGELAFDLVELVVWFYAMELLATRSTGSRWLRTLASLGFSLIVARGALEMFG
jgi:UDP-GlcNAc:undecaprenyl-phosphate/decaprenyl-phosphate GlcNAc-1-phosphate transferase